MTDLVYHDEFIEHLMSPGHPESPNRLRSAMESITAAGLLESPQVNLLTPQKATLDKIHPIHDEIYLEGIREKSEKGGGFYTMDTVVNSHTYDAALLAAGGGIEAVDRIMQGDSNTAFALCRPPGHHAEYKRAFGFCFINNVAVAAEHLLNDHSLRRIMIVDYDAHHGNGTQRTFYSSNNVLYVGLHQDGRTLFPGSGFPDEIGEGSGKGYTVNLAMYPGAGDASYDLAFDRVLNPLFESYEPEFLLVSVGYDGHFKDPLTSLGLTTSGFAMLNSRLNQLAKSYTDGKIACFLEGGYNLEVMGMCSLNLLQELSGLEVSVFDDSYTESETCSQYTEELIERVIQDSPLL
ncbi:MAG: histone deacetylase family protein [Candidatus Thorarchaeota archaeon]|jgi:acetoin utilization deacetylase AcuC-like enzyme